MPLIDKNSIKSFLGSKSFATSIEDAEGHESAVAQAENIVYQKTLVPIPGKVEDAIPTLQFCAHCIYVYIISTRQNLKEEEIKRREGMFDKAIKMLDRIQEGKDPLYDKSGNVVSTTAQQAVFHCEAYKSERL